MSDKFPDWSQWLDRVGKCTLCLRDHDPKVEDFEAAIANAAGLLAALTIKREQRRKEIEEWAMQSAKLQEERVLRDALKRLGVDVEKIKSIQEKEFLAKFKEQLKGTG